MTMTNIKKQFYRNILNRYQQIIIYVVLFSGKDISLKDSIILIYIIYNLAIYF